MIINVFKQTSLIREGALFLLSAGKETVSPAGIVRPGKPKKLLQ
jgi:hypothetical protein